MKQQKLKSYGLTALICIAIIAVLFPMMRSITYAVPSSDDFWKATIPAASNVWAAAFEHANWFYQNWYGGWIWEFLEVLLNPLVYFDPTSPVYGYCLIACLLIFLIALAFLIKDTVRLVFGCNSRNVWLFAFAMILLTFFNVSLWTEVFYWFCGSTYARAMTLMLIVIDLVIRNYHHYSKWKSLSIAVIGAIACTSYTETIFPGMVFVLFIISDAAAHGKIDWKRAYPLFFMVAGGLTTVLAPGNGVRYATEQNGASMHLADYLSAVGDAAYIELKDIRSLLQNPIMIVFLVVCVILGISLLGSGSHHFTWIKGAGLAAATLICLFLTYYPFILGYAGTDYLPNRMKFVFVVYALLAMGSCAIYLGGILSEIALKENRMQGKLCVCSLLGVMLLGGIFIGATGYYKETPIYKIIYLDEAIQYAHDRWIEVIGEIEASEADDVEIVRPYFDTQVIKPMGIAEDTESLQYRNMAAYFGKETLLLRWEQ
jgi:hypothetical protein